MRPHLLRGILAAAFVAGGCADRGAPELTGPDDLIVPVFANGAGPGQTDHFRTHLTGAEEVPARDTDAQGQAIFKLNDDGTAIEYKLIVANIENVTQAHIHLGAAGATGGIVVWLYPAAPPATLIPGRTQGVLGEGIFDATDLVGALAGATLQDLLDEIRAGNTYVNVHTLQFPPGEIRGQLD
jgi:hypothetical protein